MKFKQVLLIAGISAATAVGSVWTYNHFFPQHETVIGSSEHGMPANYVGFFDGKNNPAETVDLTKAANAAVPAVVHIKTKIPAKKISTSIAEIKLILSD